MGSGKSLKFLWFFLLKLALVVGIAAGIIIFVIAFYRVNGNNMFPNMKDGDLCILFKLDDYYMENVILYKSEEGTKLGRIVAIEDQEVDFPEAGGYLVNGYMPAEEIMYQTFADEKSDVEYPIKVTEDKYFVLNDFRSDTKDSRQIGLVDKSDIIGKVIFVLRRRSF